jgi:undecaprenyl-diphosphatase
MMMLFFQLDYQSFVSINQLGSTLAFLNPLMRFFAEDGEYLFFAGILIYWFTRKIQNRTMVVQALLTACLAMGISGILSHFFYRDRPFVTHDVLQLIKHAANASFPSDHATAAFAVATAFWIVKPRIGKLWLLIAACIAFSRVWTGVHYPSDVLAGALIGAASAGSIHGLIFHSSLANKIILGGIRLYEALENKVWPGRLRGGNTHAR